MLLSRPALDWEGELNALGIPAGRILSVKQALGSEQYRQRDQIARFDIAGGRQVELVRTGVHIDGAALTVETPPPELGADTGAVLAGLGYGDDEIAAFREDGVI